MNHDVSESEDEAGDSDVESPSKCQKLADGQVMAPTPSSSLIGRLQETMNKSDNVSDDVNKKKKKIVYLATNGSVLYNH